MCLMRIKQILLLYLYRCNVGAPTARALPDVSQGAGCMKERISYIFMGLRGQRPSDHLMVKNLRSWE